MRMDWAPREIALSPDPQTWLGVWAGVAKERPAFRAASRATFWPLPACRTLPITTSPTASAATPARTRASVMARAPSWTALSGLRLPPKVPTAVRVADRI
jgi:hypothetical protein